MTFAVTLLALTLAGGSAAGEAGSRRLWLAESDWGTGVVAVDCGSARVVVSQAAVPATLVTRAGTMLVAPVAPSPVAATGPVFLAAVASAGFGPCVPGAAHGSVSHWGPAWAQRPGVAQGAWRPG